MNNRQLNDILLEVQKNHACHQKFLQVLEKYYKKTPFDEFFRIFMHKIRVMFQQEIIESNPYVERFLDFCAQFVALITKKTENDDTSDYNNPYHPFLNRIIEETLKFHRLKVVHARYHSCKFITLILKHIGSQIQLNNDICDQIQEAMLERINDPKPSIQIQAILAMVRLQEPLLPDCPVIKAYVASFYDVNAHVRRAALCRVAPNTMTITKIIERVRDVDHSVRLTAFQRCADIGPRLVKIVDRQSILKSGFSESQTVVRKVFIETLLPKWLTHYDRDYLKFIQGLKLDADEEDIETTYNLAMMIMNVFFGKDPIGEIISALPVAEDKLVPVDELTSDIIMYWCILSDYLRDLADDGEEYLEKILPDFTPFCNYIDSFIKFKTSKPLDEWENMDYQCILNYLLEMAKRYDFSDEVGRRTFNDLIWSVLQNRRFQPKITSKLITIAEKLSTNQESFIRDICSLISEIEKPLVDNPPSPQKLKEKEFLLAQLRVKINILEGDREDAIDKGEYAKLEKICKELNEVKEQVTNLTEENTESAKVRVVRTDSETICHCLDLMIGVLSLVNLKKTYASLRMIYTEFVSPLLTSNVVEINWRVLNCLGLFSIIDKDIAQDNAKIFCIPIATYRAIPNYNKNALITSVNAICDLIRIYGVSIFGEEENSTSGSGSDRNTTRRRLYRNEDMDDVCVVDQNRMSVDFMIEIILDMLDDECDEIRNVAMDAIAKLILNGFSASSLVLSRLILKWYNPLTEKQDVIQQKLGVIIVHYTKTVKGAREVVEKAVLPILTSISNAPKSSPLADIDVDNMLRFLATLTNTSGTTDIVHVHSNLAHTLCNKIASKPNDNCAGYMAKMLLFLEIPPDGASIKELIRQAEFLLEHLTDKWPKKNVGKFIDKLKNQTASELTAIEETVEDGAEESTENVNVNKRKDLMEVTTPENSAKRRIVEKEVEPLAPLQIVEGTRRSVRTETLLDTSSSASSLDSVRSTRKKSNKKVVKEKENTTPQKEDTLKNVENTNVTRSVSKKIAAEVKNKIGGKKTQEVEKRKKDSRNGNRQEDKKNSQEIKNKHVNNKKSQSNKQTNVKNNKTSSEEDLDQVTTSNKHVEKSSRRNSKRSQEIKKIVSSPNKQKSTNNTTNPHQTRNASKKNSQEEKFSRSSSAPSVGQTNAINGVKTRSTQKEKRGIKRALSANAIQSMVRSDVSSPLRKKNRSKVIQPEKGTKRKEIPKSTSSSDFENSPSRKSPRKPKRKKMDDFVL